MMLSATYCRLLQSRSFRPDGDRKNIRLFAGLFLSASLVCLLPMPLWCQGGQVINATLTGTVLDPSESAIATAKVTLTSPSTGLVREFTTSANGSYTFTLIPPGVYQLKVEMAGFAPFQQDDIELTLGQASRLDVKLQVKSASQRVEVTGAPPLLDTENVNLGSVVSTKQIVEMPLNFRSTFWLVNLDSNVNRNQVDQSTSSPGTQGVGNGAANDQDSAEFNFSGTFFGTQALLLDGHWDGGPQWDGLQYAPTVEETDEFMVQTNTFSPQYGWSMGNVLNAITKSGTRDLHGGAFDFLRNSIMDANNFFSNAESLPRPAFRRNQFGAYLGGPIYIPKLYPQRDKTFFFFNWESTRETSPSNFVATVPTARQLRGDFSQTFNANGSLNVIYDPATTQIVNGQYVRTPFSGNQIPAARMDPVAAKMAAYWPAPNRAGAAFTGQNNFVGAAGLPFNSDAFTGRVDQNITDNQRIFFRYSHKMETSQRMGDFFGANDPGGPGVSAPNPRWDAGLQYTYAINPTLVLNATLGMNRWNEQQYEQNYPFDPSGLGLPATLNAVTGGGSFPNVSISGVYGLGGGGSSVNLISETRTDDISLTKVNGAHTLTAGFTTIIFHENRQTATQASFSFNQQFTQGPTPLTADPSTGAGLASFLLGLGSGSITNQVEPAFGKDWLGWYSNDEWKVSRNLTLNLGLRYDFQTAPTERFNRGSYLTYAPNPLGAQVGLPLDGGLQFTGHGKPRGMYDPQYSNVAPRLGLSWSPTQRLVVRSAFGTFYIPVTGLSPGLPGYSQSTPWIGYQGSTSGLIPGPPLSTAFSNGLIPPPGSSLGELTQVGQGISGYERAMPTPYVEQWTFGLEYQLPANTVVSATYIGNHGVKLPIPGIDRNQLAPQYLNMGSALLTQVANPFYGYITSGSLAGPKIAEEQLLRPFPQFTNFTANNVDGGMSTYNAFTISARRRFAEGLQFMVNYTGSKFLTNTEGLSGFSNGQSIQNYYNLALEKSLAGEDIPRSLVASFIYELPIGAGKKLHPQNRIVNGVVGGWQLAGIYSLKSGFPLAIRDATNNDFSMSGTQRPNIVGNPNQVMGTLNQWFNINAFAQPAPFTFGDSPRLLPNTRADGTNDLDAILSKYWQLWSEEARLQLRFELYNALNHAMFYAPNTSFGNPAFGTVTGALPPRDVQLGMKLTW